MIKTTGKLRLTKNLLPNLEDKAYMYAAILWAEQFLNNCEIYAKHDFAEVKYKLPSISEFQQHFEKYIEFYLDYGVEYYD